MHSTRSSFGSFVAVAAIILIAGACDDAMGPGAGDPTVGISFATVAPTGASPAPSAAAVALSTHGADATVLEGTNGTLTLTDVRLIVAEFELDRAGVNCDEVVDEDACEKFEAPPAFIDLPLAGGAALAVEQPVPAGEYKELDFEIEDLEDDEDEAELAQQIRELRDSILAEFPDWPDKASVLVTGEFTPTAGTATEFRAYFEAEIEIERHFEPPLLIADGGAGATVTVNIDPSVWFRSPDGTVLDLTEYDYDATGQVWEFKVEFEDGVTELEWEDDD